MISPLMSDTKIRHNKKAEYEPMVIFMPEYKQYQLADICTRLSSGKNIPASQVHDDGAYPVYGGNGLRGYTDHSNFTGDCAIIGRQGVFCGNVRYFRGEAYMTEHAVVVCANEDHNTQYLAYVLSRMNLGRLSGQSAQPGLSVKTLAKQVVELPPLETQNKVVAVLSSLDSKIELNQKVNDNLQQQANLIFQQELLQNGDLPEGWSTGCLLDIANYLNGLAMQRFRPDKGEVGLPVLKIKELRQGYCDASSEQCSPSIKSEYIVHDGDVIFSWSGSLLVDLWCGGTCGLNQHLFKVTSNYYPKWFYYAWTAHHLERFAAIAADKATTMGHIKREELAKAEVVIPDSASMERIGELLQPMHDLIISNRIENRKLANLRDMLLPKLMSGEIDIGSMNK